MNERVARPVFTPGVERVLERAGALATELGHTYVGTEHVLTALMDYEHGIAAQVLDELGVTEAARDRLHTIMDSPGYRTSHVIVLDADSRIVDEYRTGEEK